MNISLTLRRKKKLLDKILLLPERKRKPLERKRRKLNKKRLMQRRILKKLRRKRKKLLKNSDLMVMKKMLS